MSIFNTGSIHSMTNLGSSPVTSVSVHESMTEGAAAIIYESELNFSNMMKAIGINEVNYFAENGTSVVYEGTTLSSVFTRMKEFFRSIAKKIKELFNKFIMQIDAWIRSDKDFVTKHRAALLQVNTKGFEYKGYKFTTNAASAAGALSSLDGYLSKNEMKQANINGAAAKLDGYTKAWKDNRADHIESMRGSSIGKNEKLTAKEFDEALFKLFRNGDDKRDTITGINTNTLLDTISNFKTQKDAAKKSMESIDKNINKIIEGLNKQEREIAKFAKDESQESIQRKAAAMRFITELSAAEKDKLAVIQKVHSSQMSSMKHENRQAKSICVRMLNYAPKNESAAVRESAVSGLDSVKFV